MIAGRKRPPHRWPRRWPGWATGGPCWWWRRCSPGRAGSTICSRRIPGIAANILSERLKRLEREALLVARPYSERPPAPPRADRRGQGTRGGARPLAYWGSRHADPAQAPRHPACGTPIEARWYCPTCDRLVDHEPNDAEVHFVSGRTGRSGSRGPACRLSANQVKLALPLARHTDPSHLGQLVEAACRCGRSRARRCGCGSRCRGERRRARGRGCGRARRRARVLVALRWAWMWACSSAWMWGWMWACYWSCVDDAACSPGQAPGVLAGLDVGVYRGRGWPERGGESPGTKMRSTRRTRYREADWEADGRGPAARLPWIPALRKSVLPGRETGGNKFPAKAVTA